MSVDEVTLRAARIRAAELGTSLSALVRGYLRGLADGGAGDPGSTLATGEGARQRQRLRIQQALDDIHANHRDFRAADNLAREELYGRVRVGAETGRNPLECSDDAVEQ